MNSPHLDVIKEYVHTRDKMSNKHLKFAEIIDKDFNNGFDKFLYKRIPMKEINEMNANFDKLEELRDKMYELTKGQDTLDQIEECAREHIRISNIISDFYDKVFDCYEQYNLGVD